MINRSCIVDEKAMIRNRYNPIPIHVITDKFPKGIRDIFVSFQGGLSNCIEYIGKFFI